MEKRLEIFRHFRAEFIRLPIEGEGKLMGMERMALDKLGGAAIHRIANERMANRGKMNANLMGSAGNGPRLYQAMILEIFQDGIVRAGRTDGVRAAGC